MAIYLTDPRYQAIDQLGYALGQKFGADQQKQRTDSEVDKGVGLLAGLSNKSKEITNANNQVADIQEQLKYINGIKGLNKEWADIDAVGTAEGDAARQDIIQRSNALRQMAQQKGYNLPGQDVPLGNIQGWTDNEYNARIAPTIQRLAAAGVDLSQFARPSDMGRDAGATAQPTFDVNASISGISNAVKQALAQVNDPLTTVTGLQKLHLSDAAMQRLAPIASTYTKSNNDQQAIKLAAIMIDPNASPQQKTEAAIQYNQLYGNNSGTDLLTGLAPQRKAVQWNNGGQQGVDVVTMPSTLGTGGAGVTNLQTRDNTLNPGQVQQGQEFTANLNQNNQHFWANLNLQAQKLQNDITNDAARIQLAQKNGALSGFSTLLTDLRGRAGNALRGAQEAISAHKMDMNYKPENDSTVQNYMKDYQAFSQQADVISNQLGAAMGVNVGSQGQRGSNETNVTVDYNNAISQIGAALKKNSAAPNGQRWNRQQFESYIRQNYGDLADKLISDAEWKSFGM